MTSEVGNGFSFGLLGPLSSAILTVLPDFLPLQRINRGCRLLTYSFVSPDNFARRGITRARRFANRVRAVVGAFLFFPLKPRYLYDTGYGTVYDMLRRIIRRLEL